MGAATAIGEQPIKGLVNPESGARMSVGEALTNLVFAQISKLKVSLFDIDSKNGRSVADSDFSFRNPKYCYFKCSGTILNFNLLCSVPEM